MGFAELVGECSGGLHVSASRASHESLIRYFFLQAKLTLPKGKWNNKKQL